MADKKQKKSKKMSFPPPPSPQFPPEPPREGPRQPPSGGGNGRNREPVRLTDAAKAFPGRVILPIVLLVVVAVAVAFTRPTTYSAQAHLAVGRIDVSTAAAPGVVSASQSLASAYSRAISADEVTAEITKKAGEGVTVSASPIPESPVILIEAEASSEEEAINAANIAGGALIAYINKLNSNAAQSERLLKTYAAARGEVTQLERQVNREAAKEEVTGVQQDAKKAAELEAKLDVEILKTKASEAAYRASLEEETNGNDLRVLTTAQEATSNRKSVLKILLVLAVIAGAAIGLAWAWLGASRGFARRRTT
jgi:hypothetical protein